MSEHAPDSGVRTTAVPGGKWRQTFAALRYRNYRLWFNGQIVSLFGTWMQTTAQGFLVFELTHSPAYLGYVGFASGIPTWFLTLYGGVIADRIPRRTLLIITQSAMMVFAFALAALTFLRVVQPWHILVLAAMLGFANSFDAPARQAFVSEMVDREDLTNAIALNSTMFNSATAVGPAIAGLVYAAFGPGWCFTVNGLSFLAVIAALWRMEIRPVTRARRDDGAGEFREGIRYVARHRVVRVLIATIAVTSMCAMSLATLVPAWAVNILKGGPDTNGFLFSARGAGALIGALAIASLGRKVYRGKLLVQGALVYPLFLALFAFLRSTPVALLALVGVGVGTIMVANLSNAIVQTVTPDALRGRVMGAYTWIFFGFMPVGALLTGLMASAFGLTEAVVINAALAFIAAVVLFWFFPEVREQ